MMRSLWSGVGGLQAHQTAMDVEGNNIANVNTNGFKYSRANFSTMFSQTVKIATIPTDGLGGQNPMQVGLGTSINSTTRIHSQGSVQTTDAPLDVAINGDGFFMVSDDGGMTRFLTRDGAFNFDATGNLVNNGGYVVQGWNVDWDTQTMNTSLSPENIFVEPGMHIPAQPSTEVALKANLNSGGNVGDKSRPIYGLDSVHGFNLRTSTAQDENDNGVTQFYTTSKNALDITEKGIDMGAVFNGQGNYLNLRNGQGIWVSYADATFSTNTGGAGNPIPAFDPNLQQPQNQVVFWGDPNTATALDITLNGTNITNPNIHSIDDAVNFINTYTAPTATRDGTGVVAVKNADGSGINFVNDNSNGTTDNMKNINLVVGPTNTAGEQWNVDITQNPAAYTPPAAAGGANPAAGNSIWMNGAGNAIEIITAHKYTYSSSPITLPPMINPDGGPTFVPNGGNPPTDPASLNYFNALQGSLLNTNARVFRTTEDLRELMQRDARYGVDYNGTGTIAVPNATTANMFNNLNEKVKVIVNADGYFDITNANEQSTIPANAGVNNNAQGNSTPKNLNFNITGYSNDTNNISTNDALTTIFKGFDGTLPIGNQVQESQQLKLSALTAGLEIYDSLGSKHVIDVEFTKQSTTQTGGNTWQMVIRVPEPGEINTTGEGPVNIIVGSARFNNDGSLASYTPKSINFSANNGSAPNQQIKLSFGTSGANDGLVSSNLTSSISNQATDGYAPGTLKPNALRVDENGNIIGDFDNDKQFVVAKIAMGGVANNAGLEELGGNLYRVTGNSGDIVVGEAGTGGRGQMKTSSLEMSNADLSRSLTELIVIQRGYQANSKTITTSDQMLNTLLQLKQ